MLKVLWIPSNLKAEAICYYRTIQPATFLNLNKCSDNRVLINFKNDHGMIDLSPFQWADVIVTQRFYEYNDFYRMLMKGYELFKGRKIYDADDLVWNIPYRPIRHAYKKTKDFTDKIINEADVITCPSEYLKQQFLKRRPDAKIEVIPNSIDFSMWQNIRPENKTGKVRILYAAGGTHWKEIKFIKEIIKRVKKTHDVETILLSPYFKEKEGDIWNHVYNFVPFKNFPEYMQGLHPDICLAPIYDKNHFMLSKSNIKFLDYTMAGAASILEDCACYSDAENAIKVNKIEDWVSAIIKLLDKDIREDLQKKAYDEVYQKFNISTKHRNWKDVING